MQRDGKAALAEASAKPGAGGTAAEDGRIFRVRRRCSLRAQRHEPTGNRSGYRGKRRGCYLRLLAAHLTDVPWSPAKGGARSPHQKENES